MEKIKVGLNFKLNDKDYTLTGFREGLPLITSKETGQVQKITDKILEKLLKRGI